MFHFVLSGYTDEEGSLNSCKEKSSCVTRKSYAACFVCYSFFFLVHRYTMGNEEKCYFNKTNLHAVCVFVCMCRVQCARMAVVGKIVKESLLMSAAPS